MVDAHEQGHRVIFVSSGAIAAGLAPLGFSRRPVTIPDLQACAAVGQSLLMQAYNEILARRGYVVAQLLLTHDDFQDRRRYLNLRNMLAALHDRKVLPVINENDSISVDEIKFGDNDTLGAFVSNVVDATLTVILSDVDGLYTANPRRDPTRAAHHGRRGGHPGDRGAGPRRPTPTSASAAWRPRSAPPRSSPASAGCW